MAILIDVHMRDIGEEYPIQEPETFLARVCQAALSAEGWTRAEVSILITDDEEIRGLNHTYRGIDDATDVLSFPLLDLDLELEESVFGADDETEIPALGDIVISWPRVVRQAEEYGHSIEREVAFLVVHGTLHLLGYDHDDEAHERVMEERQEAILSALQLNR